MQDYFDYDYEESYKEDWEEHISNVIQAVVDKKTDEVREKSEARRISIIDKNNEISKLKNRIKEIERTAMFENKMTKFASVVTSDNIFDIIESIGLEKTNTKEYISGMGSDKISDIVKLIILYYNNREFIFDMFDLFDINYNSTLKEFILPRDYSKDMVLEILKDINWRTIRTNSCYTENNFGFWLEYTRNYTTESLSKKVPSQEIFINPIIGELFSDIYELLKSPHNKSLLDVTCFYQFSDDQIIQISKLLDIKKHRYMDVATRNFIGRHSMLLFENDEFCEKCFKYADKSRYSIFSISRFKLKYQIKYLKNIDFNEAIEVINNMRKDDSYKKHIIKEISK